MSNYRTEKCCLHCKLNADELCEKGDLGCSYYDTFYKGWDEAFDTIKDRAGKYMQEDYLMYLMYADIFDKLKEER